MKKDKFFKGLSLFLCIVLIAVTALFTISCRDKTTPDAPDVSEQPPSVVLGEGKYAFLFNVTGVDGSSKSYEIHTDKTIVGEALSELELISGEIGDYGLYVKTVDGTTLDYDRDGKYWAFYVDGEYSMSGIDSTEIESGKTYTLKAE